MMGWTELQNEIKQCIKCKANGFSEVKCPEKRVPILEPKEVRILFISEAPPANTEVYFYNVHSNDQLRKRLFEILHNIGYKISSLQDFVNAGFYLLPTVKCPSIRNGRNSRPTNKVIRLCVEQHLKREIEYIKPNGIVLLGRTALKGFTYLFGREYRNKRLSDEAGKEFGVKVLNRTVKVIPSYWPTKRHGKYNEISKHVAQLTKEVNY